MTITTPTRRLARVAAVALTIVAVAGCSSSSDDKGAAKKHDDLKRAASVAPKSPPSTAAPSATSAPAPAAAPCTTAAAQAVIGAGSTVTGVACSGNYMSGTANYDASGVALGFMMLDVAGQWQPVTGQALTEFCASPDLPSVLQQGCYDN